jgi:hypothetical protein
MATLYVADCSKMPSRMNCDLKITGSDRFVVEDTAYFHALSSVHHHAEDEPGLREEVSRMVEVVEM